MLRPGSIAIVFYPDEQHILLVQRSDTRVWTLPGGGIDHDETPAQCVVREVLEETSLQVEIVRQVALYTPINQLTSLTYVFECRVIGGVLKCNKETYNAAFWPLASLPNPFFALHGEWIADAQRHEPSVIHKPLTQVTYSAVFFYFCRHPFQVLGLLFSRCKSILRGS